MPDPAADPARKGPGAHRLRLAALRKNGAQDFLLEPDAETRAAIADELELSDLRKLRFRGRIEPSGRDDWRLTAELGATVVQPCVATLAPVTTRIDTPVSRLYTAEMPEAPAGEEVEMPEDDSLEPLPDTLDLHRLMIEELALALPLYPHADESAPVEQSFAPPGAAPLTDEPERKPFAGLAALRDKLEKDEDPDGE
jgi:uncharacterized metal-binding protein YceD (DUF177 family)